MFKVFKTYRIKGLVTSLIGIKVYSYILSFKIIFSKLKEIILIPLKPLLILSFIKVA
jgi:hypothetical protein